MVVHGVLFIVTAVIRFTRYHFNEGGTGLLARAHKKRMDRKTNKQ
jgi:hypothetical protein